MSRSKLLKVETDKYNFIHSLHSSYGKKSTRYAWFEKEEDEFVKLIRKELTNSVRILDMGCGKCGFIQFFAKRYSLPLKRFHGMDISSAALKGCPSGIITTVASIDSIPSEDRHFTSVVHFDGMEHIPVEIEDKALDEMMRVADRNVFLTIHMGGCVEDRLMAKHDHGPLHINIKNFKQWREKLDEATERNGFRVAFMENYNNHVRALLMRV